MDGLTTELDARREAVLDRQDGRCRGRVTRPAGRRWRASASRHF